MIYDDSQNDSPWGAQNELHRLYATWDGSALYLGVSGVQKDGNNLIVYIDTSPLDGIADASLLKEPGNPAGMWWWRRGNKFAHGFRPDFQWHLYEMKLEPVEGHGFFRLRSDDTTANLNGSVEQKASGGGAGNIGYAEIKIPWQVLFGAASFPSGEEIRIAAAVTGGMDTRGTGDPSDDIFGSARDTIPDQKAGFPGVWHDSFTIDTWLALNLSGTSDGRSSVPRSLVVTPQSPSVAKVSWQPRGVIESNLDEYRLYYAKDGTDERYVRVASTETSAALEGLVAGATYHFFLRAVYSGVGEGGRSETLVSRLLRPSLAHSAQSVFCFPGKILDVEVESSAAPSAVALRYLFNTENVYRAAAMNIAGSKASYSLWMPSTPTTLKYYFEITDSAGTHLLPVAAPALSYAVKIEPRGSAYAPLSAKISTLDFGGGVLMEIPPGGLATATTIYFEYSSANGDLYGDGGLTARAYYDFYALDERGSRVGVVFEKPAAITLRYFDDDIAGVSEYALSVGRIAGARNVALKGTVSASENKISFVTPHLSRFAIFSGEAAVSSVAGPLKKVVRPIFNPSLGEVVEFDCETPAKIEIFDLRGRLIRSFDGNFWDGRDSLGSKTAPGVYLYRLSAPVSGRKKIYGSCVVIR
ncbi:MAG: fibronectin type III domain-containing protein [Endomicrobiia bacterium]|nr:fibronectin type III domain-containing protein [Endomicrobiia bacterium]